MIGFIALAGIVVRNSMLVVDFILAGPIYQSLAVSLLFGLLSSTLLTVLVFPAVYILLRR